jgi:hypothetical protein
VIDETRALLSFNFCCSKGFEGIFGMMAGGRPRMLTEDDIKKRKQLRVQRLQPHNHSACDIHILERHLRARHHLAHCPLQATTTSVESGRMRGEVRPTPKLYTLFGLNFKAPKGMLEQAEQFKDDDVNVSQVVRVSVWEQFTRVLRELVDQFVKYSDLLDYDVTLLKSRFGLPLAVGFDCRRYLVRNSCFSRRIVSTLQDASRNVFL